MGTLKPGKLFCHIIYLLVLSNGMAMIAWSGEIGKASPPVKTQSNGAGQDVISVAESQQQLSESAIEAIRGTIDRLLFIASDETLMVPDLLDERSLQLQQETHKLFDILFIARHVLTNERGTSLSDQQFEMFVQLYRPGSHIA